MSFKLLAIRPMKGCNPKFLKNLEEGRIYKFYNDYKFCSNEIELIGNDLKEITEIKLEETLIEDFFYQKNEDVITKINVSAIVGRNGSGKSALIELLVASIVKVSLKIDKNFINPHMLYEKGEDEKSKIKFNNSIKKYKESLLQDLKNINVEIYFRHTNPYLQNDDGTKSENIRKIVLKGKDIFFSDYVGSFRKLFSKVNKDVDVSNLGDIVKSKKYGVLKLPQKEISFFKDFFYSMISNYSHYGFNNLEMGEWLKGVFHKNDGYQLPIVINPYRNEGNININIEKDLARARFFINILQEEKLRKISENKIVSYITVALNSKKLIWDEKNKRDLRIDNTTEEKEQFLKILLDEFFGVKEPKLDQNNEFYFFTLDYILNKLRKITHYPIYHNYEKCFEEKKYVIIDGKEIYPFKIVDISLFKEYIQSLSSDISHNTDKLRQALFFINYLYLNKHDILKSNGKIKLIKIDYFVKKIRNAYAKFLDDVIEDKSLREILPDDFSIRESLPSFFNVEYYFENKITNNNFNNFSSGEKQKIFSIHAVIYHLRNLKSVKSTHTQSHHGVDESYELISYENINIVFDEIELYAHPEYQRKFLKDLLDSINAVYNTIYKHNLNIIFITHSPFILSDIPKQNVLFLEIDEKTKKSIPIIPKNNNTFAENIHELLTDGFFLTDTKGDFALSKINEFLEDYKKWDEITIDSSKFDNMKLVYNSKKEKYISLVNIIGEEYIQELLKENLMDLSLKFNPKSEHTRLLEIDELMRKINELKNNR